MPQVITCMAVRTSVPFVVPTRRPTQLPNRYDEAGRDYLDFANACSNSLRIVSPPCCRHCVMMPSHADTGLRPCRMSCCAFVISTPSFAPWVELVLEYSPIVGFATVIGTALT